MSCSTNTELKQPQDFTILMPILLDSITQIEALKRNTDHLLVKN